MKLGLTILRGVIGGLFIGHGTQKLFGWFGGHGLEGTAGFFEAVGYRPGRRAALAAGVAEAGGGAMMLAGLMTPMASAALIGTMSQAIQAVHADKGPWASEGGWEYNVVIMAAAFAIADTGPGDISLDHALGLDRFHGPAWALAALAAGAAGPALLTRREQPQAAGAQAQAEPSAQSSDTLAA